MQIVEPEPNPVRKSVVFNNLLPKKHSIIPIVATNTIKNHL